MIGQSASRSRRCRGPRWPARAAIVVAAMACMVALTACGGTESVPSEAGATPTVANSETTASGTTGAAAPAGEPIRVGYLNVLSGPFQTLGQSELNGVKLAIEHINAAGGIQGRPVELVGAEDDQAQANLAASAFKKLVEQGEATIVIGPGTTAPAVASAELADSLGVVNVNLVSQPETWEGKQYVFSSFSVQDTYAQAIVDYLAAHHPDAASPAVISCNLPYGEYGMGLLKAQVESHGLEVGLTDTWDPAAFDFTSLAQKLAQASPDAILMWGCASAADGQIIKQVREGGYEGPFIADVTLADKHVPEIAGDAAESVVAFSQIDYFTPSEETKRFLDDFRELYGEESSAYWGAVAYDAMKMVAAGIEAAGGSSDPEALLPVLTDLQHEGVIGTYAWTSEYRAGPGVESFIPITFKNGEFAPAT